MLLRQHCDAGDSCYLFGTRPMTKLHPLEIKRYRKMLSEFRQGQTDRKAGRPCSSTNGRYLEGWYDPERHLPDFLTQKMLEEIENGPE